MIYKKNVSKQRTKKWLDINLCFFISSFQLFTLLRLNFQVILQLWLKWSTQATLYIIEHFKTYNCLQTYFTETFVFNYQLREISIIWVLIFFSFNISMWKNYTLYFVVFWLPTHSSLWLTSENKKDYHWLSRTVLVNYQRALDSRQSLCNHPLVCSGQLMMQILLQSKELHLLLNKFYFLYIFFFSHFCFFCWNVHNILAKV